jgi:TnpA family transposase
MKTIFLCRYLHSLELRREINEGLNVVENWNSANNFILYGKGGEFATNRREDQEITMLSLHLLQLCLVYINTLMIQQVLHKPQWQGRRHFGRPPGIDAAYLQPRHALWDVPPGHERAISN